MLVRAVPDRASNPVFVEGASELEGLFGWEEGMRISSVFVDLESDLTPEADRNTGLVIRRISDANDIEVLSFSPKDACERWF